jgi:hypothetical protein
MRENLLKEKHSGGLVRHFGHEKMFTKLNESYFWLGMSGCQDICRQMHNFPAFKGEKAECRVLSTITHTREAVGCD